MLKKTPDIEVALAGGNINTVVRVGETVRRGVSPQSPVIHQYLDHLAAKGIGFVPQFLGIDDKGREILNFVPGETEFPETLWADDRALIRACEMLRQIHDASVDFVNTSGADWVYSDPDPARREVICHHDFAPYNWVFSKGVPTAAIDFDLCGPGPRLRDLAYLAYWMAPMSFGGGLTAQSEADLNDDSRRLRLIADTYGTPEIGALLDWVSTVLRHMGDEMAMRRWVGDAVADGLIAAGHLDHWRREAAAFERHKPRILAQL